MKTKVIIIGAGPAGLTAAYELLKLGSYEVTILESSDQVGGISKTIEYNGNRMDLGGHRFFSKSPRITDFWKEILPLETDIRPDIKDKDRVMLIRRRISRIYYNRKFFDYPVTLSFSTIRNLGLKVTIQSGCSYLKSSIFKRDESTLEDFYINRFGYKFYDIFFKNYTEKIWGRKVSDIDSSWGAQRVKGISISSVLSNALAKILHLNKKEIETSLIEEFWYPKFGPGQLWMSLAHEIEKMGGTILYSHEVIKVNRKDFRITSLECANHDKTRIEGDIFISSMPIKDLVNSMSEVDSEVEYIASHLPYRDFVTVGLLVKRLKLKNKTKIETYNDLIPDCWIYIQEPQVRMGRIQIFNNWNPHMVKNPKDTVWLGLEYFCNEGDDFWSLDEKACAEYAIKELVNMGFIDACDVLDYHREKVKKAYPTYSDTYSRLDTVISYLNNIENLYCIGRNGQHRYNNMDHSMMTAFKAVECIHKNEKDKSSIWKVNTEQDYHEKR